MFSIFIYNSNIYQKLFITTLILAKIKCIYLLSQTNIIDIIFFKSAFKLDVDMDLLYLLYKNKDNPNKFKLIINSLEDDKKIGLYMPIYKLISKN